MNKVEIIIDAKGTAKAVSSLSDMEQKARRVQAAFADISKDANRQAASYVSLQKQKERAYAEFSSRITKYTNSQLALERQRQQAAQEAAEAQKPMGFNLQALATRVAFLTAGVYGLGKAFQKAFEFGEGGAAVQRLSNSFDMLAQDGRVFSTSLLESLKVASQGTISEADLMLSANTAMMLGLEANTEKMSNLMEIAAFRGRAMGLTTKAAFYDIVRGIGRMSPLILDNLGIVVDGKNTYDEYAASIGKAGETLSRAEKIQALYNRVLEEGNRQLKTHGGLLEDNATQYERARAELTDFWNEMKIAFSENVGVPFLQGITGGLKGFGQLTEYLTFDKVARGIASGLAEGKGSANEFREESIRLLAVAMQLEGSMSEGAKFANMFAESHLNAAFAVRDNTKANTDFLTLTQNLQGEFDTYTAKVDKHKDKIAELMTEQSKFKEGSKKWEEYQSKIDDANDSIRIAGEEHELAGKRALWALVQMRAAADGIIDDDELAGLLKLGESWGLFSHEVVTEAKAMTADSKKFAQSLVEIGRTEKRLEQQWGSLEKKLTKTTETGIDNLGQYAQSMIEPEERIKEIYHAANDLYKASLKKYTFYFTGVMSGNWPTPRFFGGGQSPCFIAGTMISMTGKDKPIELVEVGDSVKCFWKDGYEVVDTVVTNTFRHTAYEYLVINDFLGVTPNHPIYVGDAWMEARDIHPGDIIYDVDLNPVVVDSVNHVYGSFEVYNLECEIHNYFADGILVHNKNIGLAEGGDVSADNAYVVGEKGPELFVPRTNGKIIPNDKAADFIARNMTNRTTQFSNNYFYGPTELVIRGEDLSSLGVR